MAKYPALADKMFREMMSTDKGIREAHFARGYGRWVDGESVTEGYCVEWPDFRSRWEISEGQLTEARERFAARKAEVVEFCRTRGVLTWHAMGMDYEPTEEDGIGNFRIRTTFADKSGHVWFIEIHPHYDKQMRGSDSHGFWGEVYDVSWNKAAKAGYEAKRAALLEKYGYWWRIPATERVVMPGTKYERVDRAGLFTFGAVLAWVNAKFGTDYKQMFLERYFLGCDDIISEC